jgi:hypothetical protein
MKSQCKLKLQTKVRVLLQYSLLKSEYLSKFLVAHTAMISCSNCDLNLQGFFPPMLPVLPN